MSSFPAHHLFAGILLLASVAFASGATNSSSARAVEASSARLEGTHATNSFPRSAFEIPKQPEQGRDPFFPRSTRLRAAPVIVPPDPVAPLQLKLQGISGTPDNRLAIINGRTMAAGETAEFSSTSGKVKVRCFEVRASSCVVEIGTERQELPLPPDNLLQLQSQQ
jgi:hypothetical protein